MARGRGRQSKTYPTNVVAWLKEGDDNDWLSGILAIDVDLLEELLERYEDGDQDTVSEYDENKANIYFNLNFDGFIDQADYGDTLLGSAKLDNPVQKRGKKRRGKGRSRGEESNKRGKGKSRRR